MTWWAQTFSRFWDSRNYTLESLADHTANIARVRPHSAGLKLYCLFWFNSSRLAISDCQRDGSPGLHSNLLRRRWHEFHQPISEKQGIPDYFSLNADFPDSDLHVGNKSHWIFFTHLLHLHPSSSHLQALTEAAVFSEFPTASVLRLAPLVGPEDKLLNWYLLFLTTQLLFCFLNMQHMCTTLEQFGEILIYKWNINMRGSF